MCECVCMSNYHRFIDNRLLSFYNEKEDLCTLSFSSTSFFCHSLNKRYFSKEIKVFQNFMSLCFKKWDLKTSERVSFAPYNTTTHTQPMEILSFIFYPNFRRFGRRIP
jgi:hypothetical protein